MSDIQIKRKFKVNRCLQVGFILGILQFLIYLSGYDHILRVGPFVTHHFIELPSFFILGMGFSKFFADSGFSSVVSQILNVLIFLFNIFIGPGGRDRSSLIASYIVSFPELIGFYFHRYLIYYISDEKTLK